MIEQRMSVCETEIKSIKESVRDLHVKLDDLSTGVTRIDTYLSNGLGKRIADEIEKTREVKARTQHVILGITSVVLVAMQIVVVVMLS
jgi:hypothetical protein